MDIYDPATGIKYDLKSNNTKFMTPAYWARARASPPGNSSLAGESGPLGADSSLPGEQGSGGQRGRGY